ncbi:helix-turn-helix domain-containing protein [Tersicoccus solisilvae]|nr:helix-turn-helix domain-containing protein [Tersicoccus solisilvae]
MKKLPVAPSSAPVLIGARLRAVRQRQRLTIEEVAAATGLTKGFLSRVERDLTSPSVSSLVTVCQVLSIPVGDLFTTPRTHHVRLADAPRISLGGEGIAEVLLTDRAERRVQILHATIVGHGRGEAELYAVDCDLDVIHVIRGRLVLVLTDRQVELAEGDTYSFPGREPHSWYNPDEAEAVVTFTLVPAAT